MKNIKSYVLLPVFFTSIDIVYGSILNITTDRFEVYRDLMSELLTECHLDYQNIILYDDRHENDYQLKSRTLSPSYIKVNSTTEYHHDKIEKLKTTTKIDAVFMIIYQTGFFRAFVETLKSLRLLDIRTSLYIFSRLRNSCFNRKTILEIAWEYTMLSTYFLCLTHPANIPLIYTYNPYATYAPHQWSLLTKFIDPKTSFRIYNRLYIKGALCPGLDFDRTKYFNDNSVLKLGIELDPTTQRVDKRIEWSSFFGEYITDQIYHDKVILKLLKKSLKISYQTLLVNDRTIRQRGYNDILRVANQLGVDLILFEDDVIGYQNFSMTYPFKIKEYKIVTIDREHQNFFEHIYYVLGNSMIIMMGILLVLTFFVVWFANKKKSIAFACFDVIRLVIDASLEVPMNTASLKIFFMMVFMYFLIIQTLFQGELARFFTNPPRKELPDSLDKLISLQYEHIYYTRDIARYMKQFRTPNNQHAKLRIALNCNEYVFTQKMTACVVENKWAHIMAMYYQKISPVVHRSFQFYITRDDSPLKNRLNKAFLQLWELGFSDYISNQDNNKYVSFIMSKMTRSAFSWGTIKNRNLRFMYIFLGIGLTLGTVSFIFELIVHNRKKIKKTISNNKTTGLTKFKVIQFILNTIIIRQPFNHEKKSRYQ